MSDDPEDDCIETECPTCGALCIQGPGEDFDALSTQPCEALDAAEIQLSRMREALLAVEHTRHGESEVRSCNYCCIIAPHHAKHCVVGIALHGDGSGPDQGGGR